MSKILTNRVIKVTAKEIECMMATDTSFQFLSKDCKTVDEFQETFGKTLTLVTKNEVKYDKIKSIKKESGDDDVNISTGMLGGAVFKFENPSDYEAFLEHCEKTIGLFRTEVQLSVFKAIGSYLLGLFLTIAFTVFFYFLATGAFEATERNSRGAGKERLVIGLVKMLGPNGVLIVGLGIAAVIGHIIWKRYQNPPTQTQLTRAKVV